MSDLTVTKREDFNVTDPAAVAAAASAKARIEASYVMAYRKPRNREQARINILEACKRPMFAERVEYSKPVAGRAIKGPSIRFAELALQEWGNVSTDSQIVYEDAFMRRVKVIVSDMESNATFSKDIQVAKTVERRKVDDGREILGERLNTTGQTVYIIRATDEELQNKEAALASKAIRNEGLRLIPSDIIDEALETARKTMQNRDAEDPRAAKKKVLDSFSEIGIKPKDLEQYLKHTLDTVSPAELQELRGMFRAIRDGEATWADYIRVDESSVEGKTLTKVEDLKEKIAEKKRGRPPKPPEVIQSLPEEQPHDEKQFADEQGNSFFALTIREQLNKMALANGNITIEDIDGYLTQVAGIVPESLEKAYMEIMKKKVQGQTQLFGLVKDWLADTMR